MKRVVVIFLLMIPFCSNSQVISDKLRAGYIVDRFGEKYEGFLKLEPGDDKKPGELLFREKKGKKEIYKPAYIRSFVIEADSFATLKNFPIGKQKNREADFAKVEMSGPGGTVYSVEYTTQKTTGHAAADFVIEKENLKYYIRVNNKLTSLTSANFRDVAVVVADHEDLKSRILSKKVRFADLRKVIEEYRASKRTSVSAQ